MSVLSVQPTFPIFTDIDGQPLENGYVYIGQANLDPQSFPIVAYWDAALTITAAQPIRTSGGYPSRNGTPARIYVNSDYSIRVTNKNSSQVYTALSATERFGNLITSGDITYQANGSTTVRQIASKLGEFVSIKDFGAKGDGVTDDGGAFRSAAAYVETLGGGTIYVPNGLYRCNSVDSIDWPRDERHVVYLGSNTKIIADRGARFWLDGAVLSQQTQFQSGMRFNCIGLKQGSKNSTVNGMRFTTNGWTLDIPFRTCFGVTVGGDDCEVSDCYFDNMPGHNMIGVGYNNPSWPSYNVAPVGVKILRNTFHNGSKNVPGNTIATDCSFVYVNGVGTIVDGNRFFNDSAPITNSGGVEMHGSNITVSNNSFTNCWPAIYTGFGTGTSQVSIANKILNNRIDSCAGGIQTIDVHNDLIISNNTFINVLTMSAAKAYGTAIYSSLNGITGVSSGYVRNAKIIGNTIREDVPIYKVAFAIAGLQGSVIDGNTLDGCTGLGLSGASDVDTDGVVISNNIVRNMFATPAFFSGALNASGGDGYSSVIKNVIFRDNSVLATAGSTNTYVMLAAGTGTTLANVLVTNNQIINGTNSVAGTQASQVIFESGTADTFATVWSQSSGTQPAIGNGTLEMRYFVDRKNVTVFFKFIAGSTTTFGNSAVPWRFSLPKVASSSFPAQYAPIEVNNGVSTSVFGSAQIAVSDDKFNITMTGQTVRLDYPFTSVSGMIIRGQFSYISQ